MKKIKLDSRKLILNKEKIVVLTSDRMDAIKGGGNEADPKNPTAVVTRNACDIHTVGHDDGNGCLSASDWGWCWCAGL
ncbi:MAG TPA: class I lanthipeptide [Luteibaculaceae bacterium]|nr:class I lanthipeptide [Luteibaculaceae bacterium]